MFLYFFLSLGWFVIDLIKEFGGNDVMIVLDISFKKISSFYFVYLEF